MDVHTRCKKDAVIHVLIIFLVCFSSTSRDNPLIEEQPPLQTEEQVQEIEAAQKAQLMESGDWEDMEA
jgi:hypothetical protein